ncbi:hypothetical protein NONI108955_17260 [Nocardia ninae]
MVMSKALAGSCNAARDGAPDFTKSSNRFENITVICQSKRIRFPSFDTNWF